MSRQTPRRPSRTTTPKPRKIAGRDTAADAPQDSAPESAPAAGTVPARPPRPSPPQGPPKGPPRPVAKPPADDGEGGGDGGRGSGPTSTLLAVLGLVVLLLVLQAGWFVWNSVRDVEVAVDASSEGSDDDASDPITVPSDRPVVLNQVAVQGGVDAAATAAQTMFARNWQTYDDGVDAALELMTDTFAEDYAGTSDDVREQFIRRKIDVQVRVVAQGVVRANDAELQALIFLNQYTIRGEGPDARTTYSPYRALLTMVHTDRGWLVDGVDTK